MNGLLKRFAAFLAAAACLATAAAMVVVAAGYALFAALRDDLGPAGASAVVALTAAVMIGVCGVLMMLLAKPKTRQPRAGTEGLADRLGDLVRDRPIAAAGLAAVAGWVMTRSPALAGVLATLISKPGGGKRR